MGAIPGPRSVGVPGLSRSLLSVGKGDGDTLASMDMAAAIPCAHARQEASRQGVPTVLQGPAR